MLDEALRAEVETWLGNRRSLRLPPVLADQYEARLCRDRKRRLSASLSLMAVGAAGALTFEWLNTTQHFVLAWAMRTGVCVVALLGAFAVRRARPGWQEQVAYCLPVLASTIVTGLLGELAPASYSDRYVLAAIGLLAVQLALPPVPILAAAGLAGSGLASVIAVMAVAGGTLPLHGNMDIALFACGMMSLALVLVVRHEAARRRACLHTLRDELAARELGRMNAELLRLTNTDALTGIDNRRKFQADLRQAWSCASEDARGVGVLILDVDHFKQFNDSAGHDAGDTCLRSVAGAIASSVRGGDLRAARYGGEEFAVLASGIGRGELPLLAERVRAAVEALQVPHPGRPGHCLTISVGAAWCQVNAGTTNEEELLRAADQALYAAKAAGRNCVVLAKSMRDQSRSPPHGIGKHVTRSGRIASASPAGDR